MIKVFEAFAGIGTQRMALRNLGIEHKVVGIADKQFMKFIEEVFEFKTEMDSVLDWERDWGKVQGISTQKHTIKNR